MICSVKIRNEQTLDWRVPCSNAPYSRQFMLVFRSSGYPVTPAHLQKFREVQSQQSEATVLSSHT
jgi:hypothetical protein